MTPERWTQIEDLFHRASECDLAGRASLLEQECAGDPELRREVEALLACGPEAGVQVQAAVRSAIEAIEFPLVGHVISHYRILEGLGGGGMGLVYRAEDVKLGRQVAIKFLPEEAARNSAALARFEREARSASALEHPNICLVHEFGEHEGQPFLAMQLLEGQTLRECIAAAPPGKPPFSVKQMFELAMQIVDGLDAAHMKGIIHRDIKPANIFVTKQGQAKILDFGLAKLASAEDLADDDLSLNRLGEAKLVSEAVESRAAQRPDPFESRTGLALGTAGYMSPEQLRGERLDARTDLFSFGSVLYEMATGKRSFKGDTGLALQEAILKQAPIPARESNPQLPPKLEKIISKALEKDRAARYHTAAEIRADLQNLERETEPRPRLRVIAAGVVVLILITGVIIRRFERRQPASQARLEPKLTQLTVNSFENHVLTGTISPDGKYIAYTDANGMYIKLLGTGVTRAVPQPEGFTNKTLQWEIGPWFRDSTAFLADSRPPTQERTSQNTSIWMVSVAGGAPRKLRDNAVTFSVSSKDSIAVGTNTGPEGEREVWQMSRTGELERQLLEADENSAIDGFLWAPHGNRVIYVKRDESGDTLLSRDLSGGPVITLFTSSEMKRINDISWLPDERLLLSEPESLFDCNYWTVPLDPRTGQLIEKPKRLTNWTGACPNNTSMTADGKHIAFLKSVAHMTSHMSELTAGGTRLLNLRHFPLSESSDGLANWTPDSKALVLVSNRTGEYAIYKQPLDSDLPEGPVVSPPGATRNARITPDGKWILYFGKGESDTQPARQPEPVMRAPIGGGPSQKMFMGKTWSLISCGLLPAAGCVIAEPTDDRTQEIITKIDPLKGRGPEVARLDLDPGEENWDTALSPDGTRIAATRTPGGPIYILSLRGEATREIRVKGWRNLLSLSWAADNKGLFVVSGIHGGKVVLFVDFHGNAHPLWENTGASGETLAFPSPDGRHLALQGWTATCNVWMMENF